MSVYLWVMGCLFAVLIIGNLFAFYRPPPAQTVGARIIDIIIQVVFLVWTFVLAFK